MNQAVKRSLFAVAFVAIGVVAGAEAASAYQGHVFVAQHDLQTALTQLRSATPDSAGHRDRAITLVDHALGQLHTATPPVVR